MNRLTDHDLNYVPEPPIFAAMGAPDIAALDTEAQNYDLDILLFASDIASEPDDGGAMDGLLSLMAFNPGDFQAQNYDQINADWGGLQAGYEAQLVDNESGLGTDPSPGPTGPQPPQGPNPPSGGGPHQPPPAQQPNPGDFPGITCAYIRVLASRLLNDPAVTQVYVSSDQRPTTASLIFGDTSLWSLKIVDVNYGPGPYGSGPVHQVILTCNLSKAGHFAASVKWQLSTDPGPRIDCYSIDIG